MIQDRSRFRRTAVPVVPLLDQDDAPLLAARFFADGDPGPIVASLALAPELLEVTLPFVGAALGPSALSLRTKEIVILRMSAVAGCRYCVDSHTVVAFDAGLDAGLIHALRDSNAVSLANPAEQALVAWIDAVGGALGPVAPALAEELARHWRDFEIVELTLTIAATLMLNRYCTALALPTSPATLARLAEIGYG